MSLTQYERDLLDRGVEQLTYAIQALSRGGNSEKAYALLMDVRSYLHELQSKVHSQGVHRRRNPPLILLSNPPMHYRGSRSGHGSLKFLDLISDEAHAILYRHIEDGKPYRHDFERPTQLVAVERNGKKDVLITSEDDSPIWQDF